MGDTRHELPAAAGQFEIGADARDAGAASAQRGSDELALRVNRLGFGAMRLAWLLRRSPVMLPIPGTASVEHLEENLAAAEINLSDGEMRELTAAGG